MWIKDTLLRIGKCGNAHSIKPANAKIDAALKLINDMIANKDELTGIPTGFVELDTLLRGLQRKEMIVIAGCPGTAKSALALNIIENAVFIKHAPTLIFSLELSAERLCAQMITSHARIDQQELRQGFVSKSEASDINKAAEKWRNMPLWIDDNTPLTITEMRSKAHNLQKHLLRSNEKLGLIIVDCFELLKGVHPNATHRQQMMEVSQGIKSIAKELDVPVVVLAQLTPESGKKGAPQISQLREADSILPSADVILLLSWHDSKNSEKSICDFNLRLVKVHVAQNCNGHKGHSILMLNRPCRRFENYLRNESDMERLP